MSYMTAHPGKKLLFMGCEFGQWHEWREHEQLDWPLLQNPSHRGLQSLNRELAKFYRTHPQLHASDCEAERLPLDRPAQRRRKRVRIPAQEHGHAPIVCVFNATPVPREDYWLGVPDAGRTKSCSIRTPGLRRLGIRGCGRLRCVRARGARLPACAAIRLPPLAAVFLRRKADEGRLAGLLGATFTGEGVNFAVRSRAATRVDVCLYDSTGQRETARLTLPGKTGAVHHGFVEQELARVGTLYGIRVHGVYDTREGYRFNANKLLIDPWARDIVGDVKWDPSLFGYDPRMRMHEAEPARQRSGHAALPRHRRRFRLGWGPAHLRCHGATA
jgi:1,4-alpha-glucan branching enzyme